MADNLFDLSPFQSEAVNENGLRSLPCPPVQDLSDEENDGPTGALPNQLSSDQIEVALGPAKEDKDVKLTVRQQQMHFKSPLR